MQGSANGILCRSVRSECKLVSVKAGLEVVLDVLENQFLKVLHHDGDYGDYYTSQENTGKQHTLWH